MKKLIAGVIGLCCAAAPALAEPKLPPFSLAAQGCMKLRECKSNVSRITNITQLDNYTNNNYSSDDKQELATLIKELNNAGVEIYIADTTYFSVNTRGLYYTDVNRLFLNAGFMPMHATLLKVLRHEGWHAAQDCMAGGINNTYIAVIHGEAKVPKDYQLLADVRYGLLMPRAVPWEMEAMWAANEPQMTAKALAACNASDMWEIMEPTPKTKAWLQKNGYMKQP